jgi:hypothetical protein
MFVWEAIINNGYFIFAYLAVFVQQRVHMLQYVNEHSTEWPKSQFT